ncbi:MAG: hypothetical protein JWM58_2513 [Rhizobium sp.]|jgi:hypothetical protein|nr:hypothetical protein [Rhizobium sp.]
MMIKFEQPIELYEPRAVYLTSADGKWLVHVVEDGAEATADFETQDHAEAFAAGQRVRLGLPTMNA